MKKEENTMKIKKIIKVILYLIVIFFLTLVIDIVLAFTFTTNDYYLNNVAYKIATYMSYAIIPLLLIPLIFKKYRKKIYIGVIIYISFVILLFGTSIIYKKREESLVVKTDINIDVNEYLPFTNNTKIVKLRTYSIFEA